MIGAAGQPVILDYLGRPIKPDASIGKYRGAGFNRLMMDWVTSSLGSNTTRWELETLRNRSRDLNCNDPVASSATNTMTVNVVGQGLQPQSRLRAAELGISEDEADVLRRRIEAIFDLWQPGADAARRLDFSEIQALVFRKIIEDGEVLLNPVMLRDPSRPLQRALELVSADRLETPVGKKGIFQGVELGPELREPVRYWIRQADEIYGDMEYPRREFTGIPARDSRGRPMILHVFASEQPGQVRGVPHFAPVLSYFKNLADYLDAEVVAAKVAACLAVFITRNDANLPVFPTATETQTGQKLDRLEPGMIPYLNIGEDIKVVDFKRGGETFNKFLQGALRIIGNTLGLPYELLLKDFSQTNYSSARAAMLEAWRHFIVWRSWLTRKLCQPVWEMILEESWLRGLLPVKNFYANRAEICRAAWIGPGRGWVDPVKEIVAAKLEEDYDYATLADQCAAQGRDWEDVLEQKAREMKKRQELGLPMPLAAQVKVVVPGETTGEEENAAEPDTF